jgi:hypothetical protein
MSKAQRSKGRAGQLAARHLLQENDWTVAELNAGTAVADFWATDANGKTWSVEVKNTASINVRAIRSQAVKQSGKMPWLVMAKIDGTRSWLVLRQAEKPTIWTEKEPKFMEQK